jgi:amino acid adenylation domain-containing protein
MGIANRRVAELEPLIGMMVNSLVLRADLGGDPTFRELLERVRRTTLEAYAHQDMPFERLVGELAPERDASRNPLFQVMFSFHDAAVPDLDFGGLQAGFLVEHNRSAKTDLNVIVAPRAEQRTGRTSSAADDRAVITWEFSTDLFDRDRIERLIGHYYTLAAAALAEPDRRLSELPLLPPAEEARVLREWSGRRTGYPRDRSLVELFAERAAERGDAPAVRFGGQEIGYRELDRRAARIAHRLRELGVGRGTPVALAVERSAELVPAVLGILGAGGFYVPLDAGYPKERLAFMLADSGAPVVVAERSLLDRLPETPARVLCLDDPEEAARLAALPAARPAVELGGEDAAYLVYTSGSTGRPKGVVVPHRAVARLVLEADFARFGPDETFLQLAPLSFDAATLELWAPLLTGGRLVVAPPGPPTLEDLGRLLAEEGITTLWLTSGLFHQVVETDPAALAPLRQLLAGGDALSPEHCRRALAACPGLVLIDGYGPTENTTFTACHPMAAPAEVVEPVPIGRPIADTRVFVTDAALRPVPPGVPGELAAGGDGLARGYWRRPALTAERFVPDPLSGEPGSRLYRTGDRARWLASGRLEFLGRFDSQVKIRGFRIEPGEVEAALSACPGVAEAAVVVVETDGDNALAACLVAAGDGETLAPAALRAFLEERLPPHAVPQRFLALDRMPLTPNGKVDRRELARRVAEAGAAPPEAPEGHVAPRTRLEQALAEIWTGFLPVARVGVRDDFFDLGGHSLIATRIAARIRRDFGVALPLAVLFEEPTVERLALVLEAEGAAFGRPGQAAPAAGPAGAESLSEEELDALLGRMLAEREA